MSVKRYKVTHNGREEMEVEIDHSVMTDDKLHEINNFWGEAEWRLMRADGDIVKTVLRMLMTHAMRMTIEEWDAITAFDRSTGHGQEGWPSMDGSEGIKIVSIDQVVFDEDDIEVEAV